MPKKTLKSIKGRVCSLIVVIPTKAGVVVGTGRQPVQRKISRVLLTFIAKASEPKVKTTTSHFLLAAATVFLASITKKYPSDS